jgi:hypothetical protein
MIKFRREPLDTGVVPNESSRIPGQLLFSLVEPTVAPGSSPEPAQERTMTAIGPVNAVEPGSPLSILAGSPAAVSDEQEPSNGNRTREPMRVAAGPHRSPKLAQRSQASWAMPSDNSLLSG